MADTNVTVLDEIKKVLNMASGSDLFTDAELRRKVFQHVRQEQTYQFQRVQAGLWAYQGAGKFWLYGMRITGEVGATYTINCTGSIELTAGTDVRTQLAVMGAPVDFPEVIVELLTELATHKAQQISESYANGSVTPEEVYRKLMTMCEFWRGVVGI